ncbi:Inner membrane protein yiaA [Kluyvera cryocrescens]|uniref:Inner membrane protein yiaA n=1 Tax=Kluyvera cryocrescens TaxID=580 RepID=A0A485AJE0_KLUCR|nr:Inner membrane protein yiaA [Kluyvera cryocrescens]
MRDILKSPRLALIVGVLLYLFFLWRACPQLEDKGYFLAILTLGIFCHCRLPAAGVAAI